jgi:hypothetical protein
MGGRVAGVIGVDTWSALGSTGRSLEETVPLSEMRADFVTGSARFVELMCDPAASSDAGKP